MTEPTPGRKGQPPRLAQEDSRIGISSRGLAKCNITRGQIPSTSPVSSPERTHDSPIDTYTVRRFESAQPQYREEITTSTYTRVPASSTTYAIAANTKADLQAQTYSRDRSMSPEAPLRRTTLEEIPINVHMLDDDVFESEHTVSVIDSHRHRLPPVHFSIDRGETNINPSAYSAITQHGDPSKRHTTDLHQGPLIQRLHHSASDIYHVEPSEEFHNKLHGLASPESGYDRHEYEFVNVKEAQPGLGQSPRLVYTAPQYMQTLPVNTPIPHQGKLYSGTGSSSSSRTNVGPNVRQYYPVTSDQESQTVVAMSDSRPDRAVSPSTHRRPSYLVERELGRKQLQETFRGSVLPNEQNKQIKQQDENSANTYGTNLSESLQMPVTGHSSDSRLDVNRTYTGCPKPDNVYSNMYDRDHVKYNYSDMRKVEYTSTQSESQVDFEGQNISMGGLSPGHVDNIAAQRPFIEANVRQYLEKSNPAQHTIHKQCIEPGTHTRNQAEQHERIYAGSEAVPPMRIETQKSKPFKDPPHRPTYLVLSDGQLSSKPQLKKVKICKQSLTSFSDLTPGSSRRASFSSVVSSDVGRDLEHDLEESLASLANMENMTHPSQFCSPRHSPRLGMDTEKMSHMVDKEQTVRNQDKVTSWIERQSDNANKVQSGQVVGTVSSSFPLKTNLDKFKFNPRPVSPLSLPSSPKRTPSDPVSISTKSSTVPQVDKLREITKHLRAAAQSMPKFSSAYTESQAAAEMQKRRQQQQQQIEEDEGIGPEQTTPVSSSPFVIPMEIPAYKGNSKTEDDQNPKRLLPRKYRPYNRKLNPELEAADTASSTQPESTTFSVTDPNSARTRKKNGAEEGTSGNGGSNGRSRSDPTQDRKRIPSEDTDIGSLDSNLLISLNVNGSKVNKDTACERPPSYGSDLSLASLGSDDNSYLKVYTDITSEPAGIDVISELPDIRNGKGSKKKQPKSWTWPNGDSSQSDFIPVSGTRSVIHSSSEPVIPEVEQEDEETETDVAPKRDHHCEEQYAIQNESQLVPLTIEERDELQTSELQIISLPQTKTATEKRKERLRKVKSEDRESLDAKSKSLDKGNAKAEPLHKKASTDPGTPVDQLKKRPSAIKKTVRELPQLPRVSKTISTPNLKAASDDSTIRETLPLHSPTRVTPGARSSTLPRTASPKIESPAKTKKEQADDDIKKEVINNLLDSEKSYVRALETLVEVYMKPLKSSENAGVVEPHMVDVIFYKIPEILESHRRFLQQLTIRVTNWNDKQKVGDLIIASFNKQRLMDDYLAFVDNFGQAKETFKECKETKPSFRQFLECCNKENVNRFTFDDLIIQPVQRIPRYSLIIKELLKHTSSNHPDHCSLKDARKEIEKLGQTINEANRAEKNLQTLRSIDSMVEGNVDLIVPGREFLKQYPVSEMVQKGGREGLLKKDRALFLFSDLLMCTSVKRKSGRASISVFHPNLILEASKFKLLWKHHLDDVEILKHSNVNRRASIERLVSQLEEDINVLNQIKDMSDNLNYPHESLEDVIRELMESINKKLSENRLPAVMSPTLAAKEVEIQATTPGGSDTHVVVFNTMDMRSAWEDELLKAKQKLADSKDTFPPQFLNPIPISKTRSGMQFSCASPSHPTGAEDQREVWVCNSDGYVGQVCLLTLAPKPDVATCKTVCSARILCIAPVPGTPRRHPHRDHHAACESTPSSPISIQVTLDETSSLTSPHHTRRKNKQAAEIIAFDSDDSDENMASLDRTLLHVDESQVDDVSSDDDEGISSSHRQSSESVTEDEDDPDSLKPTMWLGTEDGCIHVYVCNDNVRTAKASKKIQHSASVQSILYHDNRVFTSLANGELVMYSRQPGGPWDFDSPQTLTIGNSNAPITKMAAVASKLWCGRQNYIIVVDPNSFIVEQHIQISSEQNHNVQCIVTSGLGVWVSLSQQSNAIVKLYHAINYNHLCDTDVTQAVHKMLAGSDAIIRQHKAACLRITALLTCKDLLWVGTSAGVVLTLPLPKITSNNMSSLPETPPVTGSGHGHTGHVRFLTAVEMLQDDESEASPLLREAIVRRCSVSATMMPNMLVISGGDGYEDFCSTSSNEAAGRDDSTNHLLLWKV